MTKEVKSLEEIRLMELSVLEQAKTTALQLVTSAGNGISMLKKLKFEKAGLHPILGTPLNLIEQLNQTFTCLVTFAATRMLYEWHSGICSGFRLNIGTAGGSDIESLEPGLVAAELFATVAPTNNNKLRDDIAKVSGATAQFRYVFFYSPGTAPGRLREKEPADGSVQVWSIAIAEE